MLTLSLVLDALDQPGTEERDHCHDYKIRGKQGQNYRQRERRKQKLADSVEKRNREEDYGTRKSGCENSHAHFFPAFFRRHFRRLAELHVTEDVLEDDHRVI